jgi:tetratricopeptide (TPR) repeat protein
MDRLVARERWLSALALPAVLALLVVADRAWLSPRRAKLQWSDAVAFWEEQAPRRPRYGSSQLRLALAYASTNRWEEAERAYARALEADPHLEEAASGRATALSQLGRGAEGRAELERFYAEHPLCAVCELSLALWDDASGEKERALERAEHAAQLAAARSDRVLEHDGWITAAGFALHRDPARALVNAERALGAVPESANAARLAEEARDRLRD